MNKVFFHSADRKIPIRNRKTAKIFLGNLFNNEGIELAALNFIFCSDNYLLSINQHHLKHSDYTDVISFRLSDLLCPVIGEVYLSTERIKENAKTYNEKYQTEFLRVMIHGALHLCGYKDKTNVQKKEMRLKEDFYLDLYSKRFT